LKHGCSLNELCRAVLFELRQMRSSLDVQSFPDFSGFHCFEPLPVKILNPQCSWSRLVTSRSNKQIIKSPHWDWLQISGALLGILYGRLPYM